MSTNYNMNNARSSGSGMSGWSSSIILIVAALAIIGVIAAVFAGAAIGLGNRSPVVNTIRVPGDYATIQAAINAARPGDIIQVRAGTYNENLTLDKAVSLTAEAFDQVDPSKNTTIIDGGSGSATILIPSGLAQMPSIRGFVIQNGNTGIQAQSEFIAEFNFFRGASIQTDYQVGGGGTNQGNVYFKPGGAAISLEGPNRPLLIENNRILYPGEDAIQIGLNAANVPATLIETDIWNNMLIGSAQDGIQFVDQGNNAQDGNRRFVITGNLLANNKRAGIGLMPDAKTVEDYSGADTVEPVHVYNNTFFGNDYGISGGDNLVAFNNIIANTTSRGVWRVQGPTGANSVVAYTLFFGNRMDTDQSTLGVGDILGQDPLFVAPPNPGVDGVWETVDDDFGGLLFQSGSPAIDKGVSQYVASSGEPIPPNPITGFAGAAPDLGWREFGSPIFMTLTPSLTPSPTLAVTATPVTVTATALPSQTSTPLSPTPVTPTVATPTTGPTATPGSPTPAVTATAEVTIQGILPTSAQAGTTANLTITGSGFQTGATVTFEGGQGQAPQAVTVQVVNATTILVTVNVGSGGPNPQAWDVRVTNPDGSSSVLADGFTVMP